MYHGLRWISYQYCDVATERAYGGARNDPALVRFLDYVQSQDKVWITRRIDIARHWQQMHPFSQVVGDEGGTPT